MPPMWVWTVSISLVALASAAFSVIEVWAHATFYKPGWRPEGVEFLGAILLDVAVLGAWPALYFGVNFYLMLSQQNERLMALSSQSTEAQLTMLRYQLNPHFLFNTLNRSEQHTSELQSLLRTSYAVFCLIQKHTTISTMNQH